MNSHCIACLACSCSVSRVYPSKVAAHPTISFERAAHVFKIRLTSYIYIANGESDWPGQDLVLDTSRRAYAIVPCRPFCGGSGVQD